MILYIQNYDNKVDLSLEEQPDMNNKEDYYQNSGGEFFVAINDNDDVVGTIGLMNKGTECEILKKFFVLSEYRGRELGISTKLFDNLVNKAKELGMTMIVLDSPSNCHRAYGFYEKHGFKMISKEELPVQYDYPERDSNLFLLKF